MNRALDGNNSGSEFDLYRAETRWRGLVLVCATFFLSSCGIPQFIVLQEPEFVSLPSLTNVITLGHSTDNDIDDFLGYELYYKFYDPATAAVQFAADATSIGGAGPGTTLSVIGQRGYLRVFPSPDTGQIPSIQVSALQRAQDFTLDISFPVDDLDTTPARVDSTSSPPIDQILVRDVSTVTGLDEGFTSVDLDFDDADVPAIDPPPADGRVPMGIVVIAYGVDFTNGTFAQVVSSPLIIPELLEIDFE